MKQNEKRNIYNKLGYVNLLDAITHVEIGNTIKFVVCDI
jgi:hypothetical protein